MHKYLYAGALALTSLAFAGGAEAQQAIEWKQTVDVPRGQNLPAGVKADILGIEIGESYADAKAKIEKLRAEGIPPKPDTRTESQRTISEIMGAQKEQQVAEQQSIFRITLPGSSEVVTASYPAVVKLNRQMQASGPNPTVEGLEVTFSAPSSGHQVVGMERFIAYYNQGDQPRIAEIVAQLKEKFKGEPHVARNVTAMTTYTFQFNNGQLVPARSINPGACIPQYKISNAHELTFINRDGTCDVLFRMEAQHGVSPEHAKFLRFYLSDNERAKANITADFAYIENYIRALGQRTRGAPPKL